MSTLLSILLVSGLFALSGATVAVVLRQREQARREAFQALAARRGWSFTMTDQKLGRPGVLRLSSRSGPGWTVESRRDAATGPGTRGSDVMTEFRAEDPRWPEGLLILAPPQGAGGAPAAADPVRAWLAPGDADGMTRLAGTLTPQPTDLPVTLLASDPGLPRIDLAELAAALTRWTPQIAGERGHPVLMLGPDGLQLRLRHAITAAERMEAFVDLGLEAIRKA